MRIFIIISILLVARATVFSQEFKDVPIGWKTLKAEVLTSVFELPFTDVETLKAEDAQNDSKLKPWRFGFKHKIDLGLEDGQWSTLPNGDKIWRLKITSKKALSLNVIFDQFYLPVGSELFLYDESKEHTLGKYTAAQNQESGRFGTWLLEADNMIIEYYQPKAVKDEVHLHIETVTHGYRNAKTYKQNKGLNDSGDCNKDVLCSIGNDWDPIKEYNKSSVGLLLSGGSSFCSGALVNNTANDGKPYFLTANHCFSNPTDWSFRFEWINPNPVCGTNVNSGNGPILKTISGATLRARNANTDFCLVEINSAIPTAWDLTWAGWDKSDNVPNYVVGIHHPAGDIMKVCRDDSGPIKAVNQGAQTWEITQAGGGWEQGVTEGGSSGSPLFDDQGRVIGQLFGGGAACSGVNDNGLNDFYGRFGVSWDGNSANERLKDWLDPNNTNVSSIDVYPPLQVYTLDASTAIDFSEEVCGEESIIAYVTLINRGTSALTSAQINWTLNNGNSTTINWTGNLAQNQSEQISLGTLTSASGTFNVNAEVTFPNGGMDENNGNNVSTKTFMLSGNNFGTTKVVIDILTDDYSDEITWIFRNSNGTVLKTGGPYNDNNTQYLDSVDVVSGECYQFEIFDDADDGICCGYGIGAYVLKTDNGTIIKEGGEYGASELTEMSITAAVGIDKVSSLENVIIYPNPFTDELMIQLNETVMVTVFNTVGQVVLSQEINQSKVINLANLNSGVYYLRLVNEVGQTSTKKIIKK